MLVVARLLRLHTQVPLLHLTPETRPQGCPLPSAQAGLRTQAGGLYRPAWANIRYQFGIKICVFVHPTHKIKESYHRSQGYHDKKATDFLYP